jgi:ubiquinone/menaquinone biosynthesis C-methylase UbiE
MSACTRLLAGVSGGRVLDVGCGTGSFTRLLAETLQDVRSIVGIDPDKDSVDEARRQTDDRRISYRILGVMELDPQPPRFDTVAVGYALHHVLDPVTVLRHVGRLLHPDGTLIVSEPFSDGLSPAQENARDVHHFKAAVDRARGRLHEPTMTRAEIRRIVREAGFSIREECTGARETKPTSPGNGESAESPQDEAIAFLDEYLPFAEATDVYDELCRERDRLAASLASHGIESPPWFVIVAGGRAGTE